jgi:hypothetical protein
LELQLAGSWKKQYMLHAAALVLTAWAALILLEEIEAETWTRKFYLIPRTARG